MIDMDIVCTVLYKIGATLLIIYMDIVCIALYKIDPYLMKVSAISKMLQQCIIFMSIIIFIHLTLLNMY